MTSPVSDGAISVNVSQIVGVAVMTYPVTSAAMGRSNNWTKAFNFLKVLNHTFFYG